MNETLTFTFFWSSNTILLYISVSIITTFPPSFRPYFTTYYHHFRHHSASILPPIIIHSAIILFTIIIIISPSFRHHFVSISPPIIIIFAIILPLFCHPSSLFYHLSSSFLLSFIINYYYYTLIQDWFLLYNTLRLLVKSPIYLIILNFNKIK